MKVLIFGASGMVGQGVLRECLLDPEVQKVVTIGRSPSGQSHAKLQEIVHADLWNYKGIESKLAGFEACFFCLGTPSSGKSEEEYTRITYDLTKAAAETLFSVNPQMTFVYVSGEGADSSEKSSIMWARVRGRLENTLLKMPFKAVFIFRPGFIQPLHGIQSKTGTYRAFYAVLKPLLPIARKLAPKLISSTELIGKAMLFVAKNSYAKRTLATADFYEISKLTSSKS